MLGLAELVLDRRIRNAHVEILVELIHRLADKEVADLLGDGVTHIPHYDRVVIVDASAQLHNESLLLILLLLRRSLLLLRVLARLAGLLSRLTVWRRVSTRWHTLGLLLLLLRFGNDTRTKFFIIKIVREEVTLLGVNNRFDQFLGVLTELLQNLDDVVHHDWSQSRESQENSVDNLARQLFELSVDVVQAVKCRLSQLLKLGLNQIVEDVHGGEARD